MLMGSLSSWHSEKEYTIDTLKSNLNALEEQGVINGVKDKILMVWRTGYAVHYSNWLTVVM
jgi:hypothetical protein